MAWWRTVISLLTSSWMNGDLVVNQDPVPNCINFTVTEINSSCHILKCHLNHRSTPWTAGDFTYLMLYRPDNTNQSCQTNLTGFEPTLSAGKPGSSVNLTLEVNDSGPGEYNITLFYQDQTMINVRYHLNRTEDPTTATASTTESSIVTTSEYITTATEITTTETTEVAAMTSTTDLNQITAVIITTDSSRPQVFQPQEPSVESSDDLNRIWAVASPNILLLIILPIFLGVLYLNTKHRTDGAWVAIKNKCQCRKNKYARLEEFRRQVEENIYTY